MKRLTLALAVALSAGQPAAAQTPFRIGIEMPSQVPVTPAVANALEEIGIQYVNYYVKPWASTPDAVAQATNAGMLEWLRKTNLEVALACYVVDPPDSCVKEAATLGPRFQGIVFDELEHCRLLNHHEAAADLADPKTFRTLAQAYEETLAGYRKLHAKYAALGCGVTATHVFPVLHHVSARAGFDPCPKIAKEFYSPVSLAIAMGAALQYGRRLTVDVDLWYYDLVPGHPPEEVWCNLLLAYWLGADRVYLEGCGHNLTPSGAQGIPFSLMTQVTPEKYQLTAHGEMLRRFIREYLPRHPRPWSFRDVRPQVAIVRFPDSDYGQRYLKAAGWHQGLYGSPNLPPTEDTEAWFQVWNLLTFGRTGTDGLTHFRVTFAANGQDRPPRENAVYSLHTRPLQAEGHRFWGPLNGAVVFDHLVGYDRLRGIPLLFLVGTQVSDETLTALRRCAEEGAVLIIWKGLARRAGFPDYRSGVRIIPTGKGKIVLTDAYTSAEMWQVVWPYVGRPDEIRYRFGERTVVLHRISDNDVEVRVE